MRVFMPFRHPSGSRMLAVAFVDTLAKVLADENLDASTNALADPSGLPGPSPTFTRAVSRRLPRVRAADHRQRSEHLTFQIDQLTLHAKLIAKAPGAFLRMKWASRSRDCREALGAPLLDTLPSPSRRLQHLCQLGSGLCAWTLPSNPPRECGGFLLGAAIARLRSRMMNGSRREQYGPFWHLPVTAEGKDRFLHSRSLCSTSLLGV